MATSMAAPQAIRNGMVTAAERHKSFLKVKSPVDTGRLKGGWQSVPTAKGVLVFDDAPYAGVVERGARPHGVNEEGRQAIREWIRRKLVRISVANTKSHGPARTMRTRMLTRGEAQDDPEVERILQAILKKLATVGQEGKFIVRDSLPKTSNWLGLEILRQLHMNFAGGKMGPGF